MANRIRVGNRYIGGDEPCFIVAEAGANHEGDFERAKALIAAAVSVRADSIKFQHYKADRLAAPEAKRYWRVWGDEDNFQFDPDHYKDDQRSTFAEIDGIPREKDAALFRYGDENNILVFSTPFDFESVDHLDALNVPMFKIASGDLTYHQFLTYVAKKGRPVVLSTGAANLDEIKEAVDVIRRTGNDQIVLLHCTLAYPAPLAHANLLMMRHLAEEFPDLPFGLSDHTPGVAAAVAAAMLGATMIEKHFTHTPGPAAGDRRVGESPDHDIGIGPEQFSEMVKQIRKNEAAGLSSRLGLELARAIEMIKQSKPGCVLGQFERKQVDPAVELKARVQARRSVVTNRGLKKGERITRETLAGDTFVIKRPGTGVAPYELEKLCGRTIACDLGPDMVLRWEHLL